MGGEDRGTYRSELQGHLGGRASDRGTCRICIPVRRRVDVHRSNGHGGISHVIFPTLIFVHYASSMEQGRVIYLPCVGHFVIGVTNSSQGAYHPMTVVPSRRVCDLVHVIGSTRRRIAVRSYPLRLNSHIHMGNNGLMKLRKGVYHRVSNSADLIMGVSVLKYTGIAVTERLLRPVTRGGSIGVWLCVSVR